MYVIPLRAFFINKESIGAYYCLNEQVHDNLVTLTLYPIKASFDAFEISCI